MSRSSLECKVYVGDLSKDASDKDLERAFSSYGSVKSVWVARNPAGFAFVEFEDPRDAEDAVRGLDNKNICGSRVRVEFATGKSKSKPWQRRSAPSVSTRRPFDPEDRCYECGQRGHYAYDCRYRRAKLQQRSRSRSPRRSYRSRSRSRSRSSSRDRRDRHSRRRSRSDSRSPPRKRSVSRRRSSSSRRSSSEK